MMVALEQSPSKTWTRFDVVRAIVALIKKESGVTAIPAQTPVLHKALFVLSQKHSNFLGDFEFDQRGDFPYAHDFQNQLVALERASHLACLNPDFVSYQILDKAVVNFDRHVAAMFKPEERAELSAIAKEMVDLVSARQPAAAH